MTTPKDQEAPGKIRQLKVTSLVTPSGKRNPTWGLCVDQSPQEGNALFGQEIYFHIDTGKIVTYKPGSSFTFGTKDKSLPCVGEVIVVEVIPNTRIGAKYPFKAKRWGRFPGARLGQD